MMQVPFALYDAFSDTAFGGSPAGVVSHAEGLGANIRRQIAREIGAPATSFVSVSSGNSVSARFLSTVMELPMCGHGTICLMTRMVELGIIDWKGSDRVEVELCLPTTTAAVEIFRREDGRPLVMLDIQPPPFRPDDIDREELAILLGIDGEDYSREWPPEIADGDFAHLVVPIKDLEAMHRITPDFSGIIRFFHAHGIETVAVFCTEAEQSGYSIHVRDFCPAVGVPESAAAGTTNAALTSYLIRHEIVRENSDGQIIVQAEQGHEIGRPSSIRSVVSMTDGIIDRLQIGGVATKILDGQLHVPAEQEALE